MQRVRRVRTELTVLSVRRTCVWDSFASIIDIHENHKLPEGNKIFENLNSNKLIKHLHS
jgi:hypothetical protein